jgi:hypothetical protein
MADHRLTDDTLIGQVRGVLSRRTLDGVLLLAPSMTEVLQLSAPGDAIWELLAEPLTVAEMVVALADHFGVPADMIRAQIQSTLDALLDSGALTALTA